MPGLVGSSLELSQTPFRLFLLKLLNQHFLEKNVQGQPKYHPTLLWASGIFAYLMQFQALPEPRDFGLRKGCGLLEKLGPIICRGPSVEFGDAEMFNDPRIPTHAFH